MRSNDHHRRHHRHQDRDYRSPDRYHSYHKDDRHHRHEKERRSHQNHRDDHRDDKQRSEKTDLGPDMKLYGKRAAEIKLEEKLRKDNNASRS